MSSHDEQSFQTVLNDIADGSSLVSACKVAGRPSKASVLRKVRACPDFAASYTEALGCRAETRVEKITQICDRLEKMDICPATARTLIDTLRWMAAKDCDRFADKQRIEATGKDGRQLFPETKPADLIETAAFMAYCLDQSSRAKAEPLLLEASSE